MRIPTYSDGKPTNLQAAILDAMYWLRWLRRIAIYEPQLPEEWNERRAQLRRAIQSLEEFLPNEEPVAGFTDDHYQGQP